MFFKKAIASVAALLTLAALPGVQAFAEEAPASGIGYKTVAQQTVVYSDDNMQTIDCRYYEDMPNVAYVSFADFYKLWTGQDLTIQHAQDDTYAVTVPYGTHGVVDIEKDRLEADDQTFMYPEELLNGDSPLSAIFTRTVVGEANEEEAPKIVFDFGGYQIDIRGDEETVWFPVTTLCDIFSNNLKAAYYAYDTLFFRPAALADDAIPSLLSKDFCDYYVQKYQEGRPADLAEYNYNEICFTFDRVYGFPGRAPFTELIREKGFDGFLADGSDLTRKIREMLHSTDIAEYTLGYDTLKYFLYDGGHTGFYPIPGLDAGVVERVKAMLPDLPEDQTGKMTPEIIEYSKALSADAIDKARNALFENADLVEQMNTSVYVEKGDTAFFIFNTFLTDLNAWGDYYANDGAMPGDMVSEYYQSIMKADKNPKIKNFVIDVAANTGGYTMIAQYMIGTITDMTKDHSVNAKTGEKSESVLEFDKNLDKNVDEQDAAFKPDLRFAVLTSANSFSSGNLLPALAHDNGVMIIGEQSGGGTCTVQYYVSADGLVYSLSSGFCMVDKDYNSIDNGIEPDYTLFAMDPETGVKDFTFSYDVETLDKCFIDFYGAQDEEPAVTTAAEIVTIGTETTATSAVVSETEQVTSASVSETKAETSASGSEIITIGTSVSETTAVTTVTAEKVYAESEIADMAAKDYESKHGTAPANVSVKDGGNGSFTVTLSDAEGKVLDVYTVDAKTAKGADSNGGTVDLPQTGNNSVGTAATAAAAAVLMLAGAAMVTGTVRKKEEA